MNFFLYGFKNSGKTTLGKLLAKKLEKPFLDTDQMIEKMYEQEEKEKLTSSQIFEKKGEAYFRELEKRIILQLEQVEGSVIALGGGSVLEEKNVSLLQKKGVLIYLNTSKEVLQERCFSSTPPVLFHRCDMDPLGCFEYYYEKRKPIYEKIADIQVVLSGNLEKEWKELLEALYHFVSHGQ